MRRYNIKTFLKKIGWGLFGILLILFLSGIPTLSQIPLTFARKPLSEIPTPIAPPRPNRLGPTNPQEVEQFFNQFMDQKMEENHVVGSVVTIVKDGGILFNKGYGYANIEQNIPVNPDQTLFRMASLSKLFTATAVMQLYEAGKLELDKDVNQYLTEFQIENDYPQPITIENLLLQNEGTTQRLIGIGARTEADLMPLEEFIPEYMPPFAGPPGELYTYSNLGMTLAGYIVQEVSGIPFSEYMERNILEPLDMSRSTFEQPLPPDLMDDLAVGYQYQNEQFEPVPFLYLNIRPAATLSGTATDMAHFMIAHLQLGQYENERILEEDTAKLMHTTHFTQYPGLPGSAYNFHERLENNLRGIGHSGELRGYSSVLTLVPEQNLGIFIATNNQSGLYEEAVTQFFDHYYPIPPQTADFEPVEIDLGRFTGTYRDIEYPRGTFGKVSAPFGHLKVKAKDKGVLLIESRKLLFAGEVENREVIAIGEQLFQRTESEGYVAFGQDESGEIQYLFNPIGSKISVFQKIPWYETILFQAGYLIFFVLVFLSALFWLLAPIFRIPFDKRTRISHFAEIVAGLTGLLNLIFIIGFPLSAWLYGAWKVIYGVPIFLTALLYIPPITAGLALMLVVLTVLGWKREFWPVWARSHFTVITIAALGFIPFLYYWNLFGWQY